MKAHSAGLVAFRQTGSQPEVLLAHMGSPWWAKKDIGAWTIPKGLIEENEDPLDTAKREFSEELGMAAPDGEFIGLGDIQQNNNKTVSAWAVEADINVSNIKSNIFEAEWPPGSGQTQEFPEIDRAAWFGLAEAAQKAVPGQAGLFERLAEILKVPFQPDSAIGKGQQASLF